MEYSFGIFAGKGGFFVVGMDLTIMGQGVRGDLI